MIHFLLLLNPMKGLGPKTRDTTHTCEVMGAHTWEERQTQLTHARMIETCTFEEIQTQLTHIRWWKLTHARRINTTHICKAIKLIYAKREEAGFKLNPNRIQFKAIKKSSPGLPISPNWIQINYVGSSQQHKLNSLYMPCGFSPRMCKSLGVSAPLARILNKNALHGSTQVVTTNRLHIGWLRTMWTK